MEITPVEIPQPTFYFDDKWITTYKALSDFDNFNILSFSNTKTTAPHFFKEPTIYDDLFPTLNLQKNIFECVDSWNPVECSSSHLINQNSAVDSQLNTPHVSFPTTELHIKEQPNFLCDEVFEDFISRELSIFTNPQNVDSFYENKKTKTPKRKFKIFENSESPKKRFKHNEYEPMGSQYSSKKIFDSSNRTPNETLFIFHKHLIKQKQENKMIFNKIKGVTYTLDSNTGNNIILYTNDGKNTTFKFKMTIIIPNIPCYIQVALITTNKNSDIKIKDKFLDRKNDKLFVYDRVFTLYVKTEHIPWEQIYIKVKKANLNFINEKFYNLYENNGIEFPIYSINEILFSETVNRPEKKSNDVQVNIQNIYNVQYIPKDNNSGKRESLFQCLQYLGVKVALNKSVITEKNFETQLSTNNDMIFAALKGIFYEIRVQIKKSANFRSISKNKRIKRDLASILKETFVECSSILKYDGVKLNTNEHLSLHDNIVFSLYLFLHQKIVNTGVEYLDTYDNLVGKAWILTDIYITQKCDKDIYLNCS